MTDGSEREYSPPRIPPLEDPKPEVAALLEGGVLGDGKFGVADGKAHNIFRTLAHNPRMLQGSNQMGASLLGGGLPPELREIVICRVAWRAHCLYEFTAHSAVASRLLSPEWVPRLTEESTTGFEGREAHLIAMVDELFAHDRVTDDTWRTLQGEWSQGELVEWLLLAGFYRMLAGFLNSAGVQPDSPGARWPDSVRTVSGAD